MSPTEIILTLLPLIGLWIVWKLDQLVQAIRGLEFDHLRPVATRREAPPVATPTPSYKPGEHNLYFPDTMLPKSFSARWKDQDAE